jgi:hypothetical protein
MSPQIVAGEGDVPVKKSPEVPVDFSGNDEKASAQSDAVETLPDVVAQRGAADRFMLESLSFENWFELLELLGLVGIVYNIASHCELHARTGDALQFGLDEAHAALFNAGHSDKLKLALGNYFGHPVSVSVAPGALRGETPAMRTMRLAERRQAEAVVSIEGDPQLQALINRFDGELDHSSIHPTDI